MIYKIKLEPFAEAIKVVMHNRIWFIYPQPVTCLEWSDLLYQSLYGETK